MQFVLKFNVSCNVTNNEYIWIAARRFGLKYPWIMKQLSFKLLKFYEFECYELYDK